MVSGVQAASWVTPGLARCVRPQPAGFRTLLIAQVREAEDTKDWVAPAQLPLRSADAVRGVSRDPALPALAWPGFGPPTAQPHEPLARP